MRSNERRKFSDELLILKGGKPLKDLAMEFTELSKLIYENDIDTLEKTRSEGVDFCKTDVYDKNNLLMAYASSGYDKRYQPEDLIDFLLRCGIDVNHKRNKRGRELTALHVAVSKMNYRIVSHLIDRGAEIDIREINGNTPLWIAVMNYRGQENMIKIINLLVSKGASLDLINYHECSVRDIINTIGGGIDAGYNKKEWDLRHLLKYEIEN